MAARRDHDVGRLEIAMHDADPVSLHHRVAYLEQVIDGFGDRERATRLELVGEIATFQEFHHEVGRPVRQGIHVEHAHHVRASQMRCRARLALETRDGVLAGHQIGQQHLDGDALAEPHVPRFVDDAHPARADGLDDRVLIADDVPWIQET